MPYKDLEKQYAWTRLWKQAHQNVVKAGEATYRAAHRVERNAYNRVYRADHLEEEKAYRAAHLEKNKAYGAAYRATHREEQKTYQAAYHAAHPQVGRTTEARRRAREKALPATLTVEQWVAILAAYKHRCAYCGVKESKKLTLTQDHVVPVSRGGGTTSDNIVPACRSCNARKNAGPPPSIPAIRLLI